MKRTFFALSILTLLTTISFACENTTVSAIVADKHNFDGKEVCVEGSVSDPALTSKREKTYTAFDLNDEYGKSISIYFPGVLSIKKGDRVKVIGRYELRKIVIKNTLYNEIDASSVEKLQ